MKSNDLDPDSVMRHIRDALESKEAVNLNYLASMLSFGTGLIEEHLALLISRNEVELLRPLECCANDHDYYRLVSKNKECL